jgi:hypothetical protein
MQLKQPVRRINSEALATSAASLDTMPIPAPRLFVDGVVRADIMRLGAPNQFLLPMQY